MRPRRDDDDIYPTYFGIGTVHGLGDPDDERADPVGRLYVPDPEQHSGWREHYIKPVPQHKPGARPIGFGRS